MAFNGYLLKIGGNNGTLFPMKYIKLDGYTITPNQRMESDAKRTVDGVLHRTTVAHTATKIEFNTPPMTNSDVDAMMTLLKGAWTNTKERKLDLQYYDMETNAYKTGTFYMPDIQFSINRIEGNTIQYNEVRVAFIEY